MSVEIDSLYIPAIKPALKHKTVFEKFEALNPGEGFILINDHDPKPLYYQMVAELGKVFTWQYFMQGPKVWEVEIRKNETGQTVGELAASDLRKAEVFKKFGIDFCCGGRQTLSQACASSGVDPAALQEALKSAETSSQLAKANDYVRWQPDFLADYIYNQHHLYYYAEAPVIADLCFKLNARHGERFHELNTLTELFYTLQKELDAHFLKEEKVLFPFIKLMVRAKRTGDLSGLHEFPSVSEPVNMMELEHDEASSLLAAIRKASNDFTPPEVACNSFHLLYKKLKALEEDLHLHIHLENNILFPKALALEKSLYL